jgi:hypothetical protein
MRIDKPQKLEYRRPGIEATARSSRLIRIWGWIIISPLVGFTIPFVAYYFTGGWGIPGDEIVVCTALGLVVGLLRANALSGQD